MSSGTPSTYGQHMFTHESYGRSFIWFICFRVLSCSSSTFPQCGRLFAVQAHFHSVAGYFQSYWNSPPCTVCTRAIDCDSAWGRPAPGTLRTPRNSDTALLNTATEQKTRSFRTFFFGDYLDHHIRLTVNEISVAMSNRDQWKQFVTWISRALKGWWWDSVQ